MARRGGAQTFDPDQRRDRAVHHLSLIHICAVALGGRYDGVGKSFGRERPATGFSLDLRELARLTSARGEREGAVLAPYVADCSALAEAIAALRAQGEVVVELLPDEQGGAGPFDYTHLDVYNGQVIR